MAEKEKPTYIRGSAREVVFDDGGSLVNFSLNVKQIVELAGDDEYINLTMRPNYNGKDPYDNTHNIILNTFKPDKAKSTGGRKKKEATSEDDLPF